MWEGRRRLDDSDRRWTDSTEIFNSSWLTSSRFESFVIMAYPVAIGISDILLLLLRTKSLFRLVLREWRLSGKYEVTARRLMRWGEEMTDIFDFSMWLLMYICVFDFSCSICTTLCMVMHVWSISFPPLWTTTHFELFIQSSQTTMISFLRHHLDSWASNY